jgi:Domain of unknown function (DUF4349)
VPGSLLGKAGCSVFLSSFNPICTSSTFHFLCFIFNHRILTMLMPSTFRKTLLAAVCSASLWACGQKSEAPSAQLSAPAPSAVAAAAAPAAQMRARKDLGEQAGSKMMADTAASDARLASIVQEPAGGVPTAAIANGPAASEAALKGRKLVLTASARFAVKSTYQSALAIEDAVVANDGYVVANHIESKVLQQTLHHGENGQLVRVAQVGVTGNMVVRVPSHKTQAFLRDIASQIEALDQRNFAAKDVQFDMLRSQLEAARNQETQAELGLLTQQKGSVGDKTAATEVRNQAKAARDEARIASSQLADQVAYSTIALNLHQPALVRTTQEVDFDSASFAQRPSFISNVQRALVSGWHGLLHALVGAVALWPLWLLLMAVAAAVVAYRSRKQKQSIAS